MTDAQAERWITSRSRAIQSRLAAMSDRQCRTVLETLWVTLAIECNHADARDWPSELHPADVLEKHLVRTLKCKAQENTTTS